MEIKVTASINRMGATTREVLERVAQCIGIDAWTVTSTWRPPQQQAEAMYNNLSHGINITYKWAGEQVCQVYRSCRRAGNDKATTLKAMVAKIEELSKQGARVSLHCVSEAEFDAVNVIDLSYHTLTATQRTQAVKCFAEQAEVQKVIQPFTPIAGAVYDKSEPAIHVEIKQVAE